MLTNQCVIMVGTYTDEKGTPIGFIEINNGSSSATRFLSDCEGISDVVEVFDNVILLSLINTIDKHIHHTRFAWRTVSTDNKELQINVPSEYPRLPAIDRYCKFVSRPRNIAIAVLDHRMLLTINSIGSMLIDNTGSILNIISRVTDDDFDSIYYLNGRLKFDHIDVLDQDLRQMTGNPSPEAIIQFTDITSKTAQRNIIWIHPNLKDIISTVINHDNLIITYTTKDGECDYDKYHVFIQPYTVTSDIFAKSGIGYSIELS